MRTRQALVRAAAEVFAVEGYALASLSVISGRAGVSAGALHFHFAGKDALAGEVEAEAVRRVGVVVEGCRGGGVSGLECLVGVASGVLLAVGDPVVRAGFRLSADPSRRGGVDVLGWWRSVVGELAVRAEEGGELAAGVRGEDVVTVVVAGTVGLGVMGMVDGEWSSAERVRRFWALCLPWLAAAPESVVVSVPGCVSVPAGSSVPVGSSVPGAGGGAVSLGVVSSGSAVSGAAVSGAGVSGGAVSGAGVSGGAVSGAGVSGGAVSGAGAEQAGRALS
ncbi:TetR/AcrR family transcriptional regulator [Streptomyces sp. NPDC006610]|uniref:TetR/AcrR family transcriptional regulator n=1 Tax=Streptomyces sp. NPDC006610 TaxID=3154584 RepID=UPI0033A72D46